MDNGPEFVSKQLADWAELNDVALQFIQPGKPTQNAYIERFKRTYRTEVFDCYVFESLAEVRRMTEEWIHRYNHERPHESCHRSDLPWHNPITLYFEPARNSERASPPL